MNPGLDVRAPVAPDFIDHPWVSLTSVRLDGDLVTVAWADGVELVGHAAWLAENTGGIGLDPVTRENVLWPTDVAALGALVDAAVDPAGGLALRWAGGPTGTVHPGWLRYVATGGITVDAHLPPPRRWTAATFDAPPSTDGADVLHDQEVLGRWLDDLVAFGLARLTGTPADVDFVAALAPLVGPVRGSNFGGIFDVDAVVEPDSTANTTLRLGQHTDLPTRETPPGFQFLHCVENSVAGGWSRMTDGWEVVAELERRHPDAHELLCSAEWIFINRSPHADHRWQGPVIDLGGPNSPLTIRAFHPVRAFPAVSAAEAPAAYAALQRLDEVAHDPALMISFPFEPGDLVAFDNRRVMHGRDAFDTTGGGRRHLRGCYLDHDDVYSRVRLLHHSPAPGPTPTEPNTKAAP